MLALYVAGEMRGAADVARNVGLARVERNKNANRQAGEFFANQLYGGNKIAVAAHDKRFVIFVFVGEGQEVYCKIDVRFLFLVAHVRPFAEFAGQVLLLELPEDDLDAKVSLRLHEGGVPLHLSLIPVCARSEVVHVREGVARQDEVLRKFPVIRPFAICRMAGVQDVIEIEAVNKARDAGHCDSNKKGGIPKKDTTKRYPGSLMVRVP